MTARRRPLGGTAASRPSTDCDGIWSTVDPANFDQLPEAEAARELLERVASKPTPPAQPKAMRAARKALQPSNSGRKVKRTPRPIDINDRIAVAAIEMAAEMARGQPPLKEPYTGAWLARMKQRGAGHCSPLPGAAEGLHLLVLDREGMAELSEAMAEFQQHVECHEQLMVDAAELQRLKRLRDGEEGAG